MRKRIKHLLVKIDERLPEWLRRLIRNREWQKSSAASSTFWVLNTLIVYKLVERLGHGWQVNVAASLAWDLVTYAVNKLWVWRRRKATYAKSASRNFAAWIAFFAFNGTLAWLLMGQANVGTLPARILLALVGIAVNPVRFRINDGLIFSHGSVRLIAESVWLTLSRWLHRQAVKV
jgi:putative flippase GtrA